MNADNIRFIQDQIGYRFTNTDLLQQAFVRKSYSVENGGDDNEILEFIGDKVLDTAVVMLLSERFGHIRGECPGEENPQWKEYACEYDEGELTEIKKRLVEGKNLSKRIDELGLAQYLIMGNSDIKQKADRQHSVKEDLFEAILGAAAIDSKWDFTKMADIAELMLNPEDILSSGAGDNYVGMIHEWCEKKCGCVPMLRYEEERYIHVPVLEFNGIRHRTDSFFGTDSYLSSCNFSCIMKLDDGIPLFKGYGRSKSEARRDVCKLAYDWLRKNNRLFTIKDEIENPNMEESVNQLETLARRGYFPIPTYSFEQSRSKNGNPVWKAECRIAEIGKSSTAEASSKKEAKKSAAFSVLISVLEGSKR